ncbi:MAG: hypothetical protein HKN82_07395 [Akkermansiaceae bacterium]|nr:hypothetical protein [Akkermansiaceae bacterium]
MRSAALILLASLPALAAPVIPRSEFFKVETVAEGFTDAMELAITPEGYIFVIERTGAVKLVRPADGKSLEVAALEVEPRRDGHAEECGLLGIALDPDYAGNKWVYLYYSPAGIPKQRLSRFTFAGRTLEDEHVLLEIPHERDNGVRHEAGSLAFGPQGRLFLATGDNTNPAESDGYAPLDQRKDRAGFDAQRTAGNTNDLRGKILRIVPKADGTYAIPEGNLFPEGTGSTRPEIFVMGCRNPFRIALDPRSGALFWGDIGPDAGAAGERGPQGYDEINRTRAAGNFGWPYFAADNKPYANYDFRAQRIRTPFDPASPFNSSPNNTGRPRLPAAQSALWFQPHSAACAGAVYHHGDYPESPTKLPKALDSSLLVFDRASGALRVIKFDASGAIAANEPWLEKYRFVHPSDMALDAEGHLYLLESGSARDDGNNAKLKRISYSEVPLKLDGP